VAWRRCRSDDPVIADPDHDVGGNVAQGVGERDRVVAGVEAEQRRRLGVAEPADEVADLGGGDVDGIRPGGDPAGVHRWWPWPP
jgi:hypothetical protein